MRLRPRPFPGSTNGVCSGRRFSVDTVSGRCGLEATALAHGKAGSCPLLDGDRMPSHRDNSTKERCGSSFNIDSDERISRTHRDGDVGHLRGLGDIARGSLGFTGVLTS